MGVGNWLNPEGFLFGGAGFGGSLASSYSASVESTAFLRENGVIVLVLHNRGAAALVSVVLGETIAPLSLPATSVNTLVISPEE